MTLKEKFAHNWKSGLTVSLVAMPLSISLAVASNTTPTVGIITALWAGLFASLFGGSNYNIVGPTGALSGLIAAYALLHGAETLWLLAVVSGVLILVAYMLKLERYLVFIPSSVITGFTLGVAFIIGFNQLNFALGLYGLPKHEHLFENIFESIKHFSSISIGTFGVFTVFLIALFVCKRLVPRIPGALLLSPVGIVLGALTSKGILALPLATLGSVFTDIAFRLYIPMSGFAITSSLLSASGAVALVAILETMLSAKIADNMTGTKHDERKEMLGLGLANLASGAAGGIPATAALARTSLNIKSGADDKLSATLHAIFLGVISFFFLAYFQYIPMAVIASILVFVAIQMVEAGDLMRLYSHEKNSFWIAIFVAGITFFQDPIIGIFFGTTAALLVFIEKVSRGQFEIGFNSKQRGLIKTISGEKLTELPEADVLVYTLSGKLTYINSRSHRDRIMHELANYPVVIVRMRGLNHIDVDGAAAIEELLTEVSRSGRTIALSSINGEVRDQLKKLSPTFSKIVTDGNVFEKSEDALRHFGIPINKV